MHSTDCYGWGWLTAVVTVSEEVTVWEDTENKYFQCGSLSTGNIRSVSRVLMKLLGRLRRCSSKGWCWKENRKFQFGGSSTHLISIELYVVTAKLLRVINFVQDCVSKSIANMYTFNSTMNWQISHSYLKTKPSKQKSIF